VENSAHSESRHNHGPSAEEDLMAFYKAQQLFGCEEYEALWKTLRTPLPASVTVDPRHSSAATVEARLAADGWRRRAEFDQAGLSVWEIEGEQYTKKPGVKAWAERENRRGSLIFQEVVSLLPALLLNPQPQHLCLDVCSAPGSKSVQLLRLLSRSASPGCQSVDASCPSGAVLSGELDGHRACVILPRNLSKAASPASCAALANAQHFPALLDLEGARLGFERILADVPCSGDGTARKNAQVWRAWKRREALELFSKQRNILLRALYLLPVGGVCAYSTCSLNPLENEAVVLSALRRWQRDERRDAPIELLDVCAVCRGTCGLEPDAGMTKWSVPSPTRGGPLFRTWEEVPQELHANHESKPRCPLRPEMFCEENARELRHCARFYPHRSNTGGFFVALFRKGDRQGSVPRSLGTFDSSGKQGFAVGRSHPLCKSVWTKIAEEDPLWRELHEFFGIDLAWRREKLAQGLLFWQSLGNEVARVSLVSPGVARIFDALPADRKKVPWIRLGVFLFEKLPKKFLTGLAATRWQIAHEGARIVAPLISRRTVQLSAVSLGSILRAEHRQERLAELPGVLDGVAGLFQEDPPFVTASQLDEPGRRMHICGGVLVCASVRADAEGQLMQVAVPGVVTPQLLRLLVDNQEANALREAADIPEEASNNQASLRTSPAGSGSLGGSSLCTSCCLAGFVRWASWK